MGVVEYDAWDERFVTSVLNGEVGHLSLAETREDGEADGDQILCCMSVCSDSWPLKDEVDMEWEKVERDSDFSTEKHEMIKYFIGDLEKGR